MTPEIAALFGMDAPGAPVHAARRTDPGTSHAAARRIASSATRLERVVVEELRAAGPLTAHEIAQRVNLPLVTISPRLAPLVRSGVVADSGERRERRTVWRVLP
jgi:predicted transcriptional regulator